MSVSSIDHNQFISWVESNSNSPIENYDIAKEGRVIKLTKGKNSLKLIGCIFHDPIEFGFENNTGLVRLEKCIFNEDIRIISKGLGRIELVECDITSELELRCIVHSIIIENCIVVGQILCAQIDGTQKFAGQEGSHLTIHDREGVRAGNINNIIIQECTFNKIYFKTSEVRSIEFVQRVNKINEVEFNRGKYQLIEFNESKYGKVSFNEGVDVTQLSFESGEYELIEMNSGLYQDVHMGNESREKEVRCQFHNIKIARSCVFQERGWFRNATIVRLNLSNAQTETGFLFTNVKFIEELDLSRTYLKNYVFNEVDLKSNTQLDIKLEHTLIESAIFSNIQWPKKHELRSLFRKGIKNNNIDAELASTLREVYRQLKNAMKATSNFIDAMAFRERELFFYEKQLKYDKGNATWVERFRLWVGRFFGDHGESLAKPIIIGISIHTLFFISAVLAGQFEYTINFNSIDWHVTSIAFSDYFNSLNPVKEINTSNGYITFFKLVRSIVLGTCIYYSLSALRKYAKL